MTYPNLESWQKVLSEVVIKTPVAAFQSGIPSFGKMKNIYRDAEINALIVNSIIEFSNFVNISADMGLSKHQVVETTKLIREYFPHLNLADLKLFFDRMKLGYYGKFFNRLDGQLILERLDDYNKDRMQELEQEEYNKAKKFKEQELKNASFHPDVIEAIKGSIGKKVEVNEAPIVREQTEAEIFNQRAIKQFNNLFRKYGEDKSPRSLKIGSNRYYIADFINRKWENKLRSEND